MTTATATLELHEAGSRIAYQGEGNGDKYKIRIMGWEPGAEYVHGSSGDYSVEGIKRTGAAAWPEGTRMRANHDGFCEDGGDMRRIIARTTDEPWAEADGLYTNMRVSSEWSPHVKEYGDIIGLSISAAGSLRMEAATDEDGEIIRDADGKPIMQPVVNPETGKKIVDGFLSQEDSPYNSIDFVEAPGADGRIVKLLVESARAHLPELNVREQARFAAGLTEKNGAGAVPPQTKRKEYSMDEETKALIAQSVSESVAAALPGFVEALKPSEPTKEEVKGEDVAEAAFEAGLSKGAREGVYERVANGMGVSDAIAKEKAREDEITKAVESRLEGQSFRGFTSGSGDVTTHEALDAEFEQLVEG